MEDIGYDFRMLALRCSVCNTVLMQHRGGRILCLKCVSPGIMAVTYDATEQVLVFASSNGIGGNGGGMRMTIESILDNSSSRNYYNQGQGHREHQNHLGNESLDCVDLSRSMASTATPSTSGTGAGWTFQSRGYDNDDTVGYYAQGQGQSGRRRNEQEGFPLETEVDSPGSNVERVRRINLTLMMREAGEDINYDSGNGGGGSENTGFVLGDHCSHSGVASTFSDSDRFLPGRPRRKSKPRRRARGGRKERERMARKRSASVASTVDIERFPLIAKLRKLHDEENKVDGEGEGDGRLPIPSC